ncbi:hypothetical protein ACKVEX_16245 [Rhodocyclaceae bacterium SMB388]
MAATPKCASSEALLSPPPFYQPLDLLDVGTAQRQHFAELRCVIKCDGVGNLTVHNRRRLEAPRYDLAYVNQLLERWPAPCRWGLNRATYDCLPLTIAQFAALLGASCFSFAQHRGRALRTRYELEQSKKAMYQRVLRPIPDAGYWTARSAFRTLFDLQLTESSEGTSIGQIRAT